MILYVVGIVWLLAAIGVWDVQLLKGTIEWFFFGALPLMLSSATARGTDGVLMKTVKDSVRIVILFEFLINTYTFPFFVEIFLVPLLALITMLDVVVGSKKEYAIMGKTIKVAQISAGFVILGFAVGQAIVDFQNLKTLETLRSVCLVPLLTMLIIPFIYIALVTMNYEIVFLRLNFRTEMSPRVRQYAKRRIIGYSGLSLSRLQYLLRNHMVDLMNIEEKSDVDSLLSHASSHGKLDKINSDRETDSNKT